MSVHHYPISSLLLDGARAAFGIAVTFGPMAFWDPAWPVHLVLGGLGAVFLLFGFKIVGRGLSPIELSEDGISRRGPVARSLAWRDVTSLKLAHYAARRRPSDGWYQLTLRSRSGAVTVESTIDGFEQIVAAAAAAAEASRLDVDPTTSENLKGLGHGVAGLQPPA